jgi:cytoskeletal protein CcmA (bactofilin family)
MLLFKKKMKAGALQYVLVISVIIAILIISFVSLVYLQQKTTIKYNFSKEAITNSQFCFDMLRYKKVNYNTETTFDFSDNELATNTFVKKHWGIFDIGIATASVKNEQFQKIALLGFQNPDRKALYLKDNNQSLVLVGNTKIVGDVALPKQGVKSGNIAGESFYGNKLIDGLQNSSNNELPKIKNLDFLLDFSKSYERLINYISFELKENIELCQSFLDKTLLFESNSSINLYNTSLTGNIVIASKSSITVNASCKLKDVILIAPEVILKNGVSGNFQIIATKKIKIEENCKLIYPSALILIDDGIELLNQNRNTPEFKLSVGKQSTVKGVVLYHSKNKTFNYNTQVVVNEGAKIIGEVFCNQNLNLSGNISGSIFTHSFIVKKAGGIYVNHIYNGTINSNELPKQYAGLQIDESSNAVMKWVD